MEEKSESLNPSTTHQDIRTFADVAARMCLDDSFDRRTWVQFWRNYHDGLKKEFQVVKSPDATSHASSRVLAVVEQLQFYTFCLLHLQH